MKTCLERNRNRPLAALLMVAFFFCLFSAPGASALTMEELKALEPVEVVRDYLMPYLENDGQRILLFGAELNISNGHPGTRHFGERYMFGKLVHATYVMENLDDLDEAQDRVMGEVRKLLLGPWEKEGRTTFRYFTRENLRVLDLETGRWKKVRRVQTILVEHWTEHTGKHRVSLIALIPTVDPADGSSSVGFSIARK